MWVRGLKRYSSDNKHTTDRVAPYMGAWIETVRAYQATTLATVTPYMGAWIETTITLQWNLVF